MAADGPPGPDEPPEHDGPFDDEAQEELPADPMLAADLLLRAGRPAEALARLEAELPARHEDHELQTLRASALMALDRAPEAVQLIHDVLDRRPEALEARLLLVVLLLHRKQPADALTMLDGLGAPLDLSPKALRLRSVALLELGRWGEAHAAATDAVALDHSDVDALLHLASLKLSGGNRDDAEQLALHALMVEPDHPAVIALLTAIQRRPRGRFGR